MRVMELPEGGETRLASLCDAAGHAVWSALGRFVGAEGPLQGSAEVIAFSRVAIPDEPLVAVAFDLSGAVHGSMVQLVGDETARVLAGRLLGAEPEGTDYGARERGALSEVGNIVASAFLNALADRLGRSCLPSVPRFLHGDADDVISQSLRGSEGQEPGPDAVVFRVMCELGDAPGRLVLLVVPSPETIERLATTKLPG